MEEGIQGVVVVSANPQRNYLISFVISVHRRKSAALKSVLPAPKTIPFKIVFLLIPNHIIKYAATGL